MSQTKRFDWENKVQTNNKLKKSIDVAIPRNVYYYFKDWTLKDIEKEWPATETGYSKDDQMQFYRAIRRFYDNIIAKMAIRSGLLKTTKQYHSFLADFGTHAVFKARFALYVQTSLKKLLTLI